jgi:hypothetical protein
MSTGCKHKMPAAPFTRSARDPKPDETRQETTGTYDLLLDSTRATKSGGSGPSSTFQPSGRLPDKSGGQSVEGSSLTGQQHDPKYIVIIRRE